MVDGSRRRFEEPESSSSESEGWDDFEDEDSAEDEDVGSVDEEDDPEDEGVGPEGEDIGPEDEEDGPEDADDGSDEEEPEPIDPEYHKELMEKRCRLIHSMILLPIVPIMTFSAVRLIWGLIYGKTRNLDHSGLFFLGFDVVFFHLLFLQEYYVHFRSYTFIDRCVSTLCSPLMEFSETFLLDETPKAGLVRFILWTGLIMIGWPYLLCSYGLDQ